MLQKNSTAPADGERRAQIGYVGQYRAQAVLVLQTLREGNLQWIKVADPQAQKLDDFQIGTPGRIDAYQIKWSEHPKAVSFNKIASGTLLSEVAESWNSLRKKYSSARFVAHLTSNDYPSTNGSSGAVPVELSRKPKPAHFGGFIKQVWEPMKSGTLSLDRIPEEWATAWGALKENTGLSDTEFKDFVANFELELDFRTKAHFFSNEKQSAKFEDDIDKLTGFFARLVASPERLVQLTRDELLRRLGWTSRYEVRNLHEFPVDHARYQPLEETEAELNHALKKHLQGYVCLLGSPGSGKSTLLTEILTTSSERVIRYYAFVPNDSGPSNGRGDSTNFLHDVTRSLKKAGFSPDCDLPRADRQELAEAFHQQIQQAGELYRVSKQRTLILIDGLDHVRREQTKFITSELFGDLPLPSKVPSGVLFVLGSQTLDPLPPRIKNHIESETGRLVKTSPLTSLAVGNILDRRGSQTLTLQQRKRVFEHSGGHPLALSFILKFLDSRPTEIEEFLNSTPNFSGDIEDTYRAYWEDLVENDAALLELLALVARLRHQFDLSWVMKWADRNALRKLKTKFEHFFTQEGERWAFFHNSFRQFVIKMTSQFSQDENRDYHIRLAEFCQAVTDSKYSYLRSESLFHLVEAEEHKLVLESATQEFFRQQFFDSRPVPAILQDIRLAKRSLRHIHDPVAAVRLSLIGTEVRSCDEELTVNHSARGGHNLLLETGHVAEAIAYVRRGMSLLVSGPTAISWCGDFIEAGHLTEAKRIFSLIDPISSANEVLSLTPQQDQQNFLVEWAAVALDHRAGFLSVERVIEIILSFEFKSNREHSIGRERSRSELTNEVLKRAGLNFIEQGQHDHLAKIKSSLNPKENNYSACIHHLKILEASKLFERGDSADSLGMLNAEFTRLGELRLKLSRRAAFNAAELYVKLGNLEKARELVQALKKPEVEHNLGSQNSAFVARFRYLRLIHAVGGISIDKEHAQLGENDPGGGLVELDGLLNDLARISAQAWIGEKLQTDKLDSFLSSFFDFYESAEIYGIGWDFSWEIKAARTTFHSWLVEAFSAHGEFAIELLCSQLSRRWEKPRQHGYWYPYVQRNFVISLFEVGAKSGWTFRWLDTLERQISKVDGDSNIASEYSDQAAAWLTIQEPERADAIREKMMRSSFEVGYRKDHQLETWMRLTASLLESDSNSVLTTLQWLAKCIAGLDWTVETTIVHDAVSELVNVCAKIHPEQAIAYLTWFGGKNLLQGPDALVGFLVAAADHKEAPLDEIIEVTVNLIHLDLKNGNSHLIERLVVRIFASLNSGAAFEAIAVLQGAIEKANNESRNRWNYGVARGTLLSNIPLENVGLTTENLRYKANENSGNNLRQNEGILTMDELEFSNLSFQALKALRRNARPECHFNWHRLIKRIASRFEKEDLLAIAEEFRGESKFPLIIEAISDRLLEVGGRHNLDALAHDALQMSNPEGWRRFMDGGTRIATFNAIFKTDQKAALKLLYEDCADHEPLARENLQYLLPLIANHNQRQLIWSEIWEHIQCLLEGFDDSPNNPPQTSQSASSIGDQFSAAFSLISGD